MTIRLRHLDVGQAIAAIRSAGALGATITLRPDGSGEISAPRRSQAVLRALRSIRRSTPQNIRY